MTLPMIGASHHTTGQQALQLTAVPRPSERDRGNLFVRLTPRTAWRLASLLIDDSDVSEEVHDVDFLPLQIIISQPPSCHAVLDNDADDDTDNGNAGGSIIIYASYNGGAPATDFVSGYMNKVDDIIELPIDLHPSLQSVFNSTSDPVVVSVRPLSDVPIAERVTFEPLTISDWEMIEMEACMLEDGGLLNQITVVSPGQVFPLRFGGHLGSLESAAWIKVVDEEFCSASSNHQQMDRYASDKSCASSSSFDSDSEFDSSTDADDDDIDKSTRRLHQCQCLRLMAETEVAVIPKPRIKRNELNEDNESNEHASIEEPIFCPSNPLRVQPASSDVSHVCALTGESYSLPNPPLGFVTVHPTTLIQIPGYEQCNKLSCQYDQISEMDLESLPPMVVTMRKAKRHANEKAKDTGCNDVVVGIIQASNSMHKGQIGIHVLLRHQLGVRPFEDWVSVQIWTESHVANSINRVRGGNCKVEITKVSLKATKSKISSTTHHWNFPDGYNAPSKQIHDTLQSTCDQCRELGMNRNMHISSSRTANETGNDTNSPAPVFSSSSIIPGVFLQDLGLDWIDEDCSDTFILKLQQGAASTDNNSLTDNSDLVPIITVKDLKGLTISDVRVEDEGDNDVMEVLNAQNYSTTMSFSNKQTVGFTPTIQHIKQSTRQILSSTPKNAADIFSTKSIYNHAILIIGEEGSGKTHLSVTAVSQLSLADVMPAVYMDCKKLQASSTNIQTILTEIQASFQEAVYKQPSVLVLDDLDSLIPNVESSDAEGDGSIHHQQLNPALAAQVKIIVDHLILQSQYCYRSALHDSCCWTESTGVILLCTCRDKDSLSTRYQASGVFHTMVEVPSLDSHQRAQFLYNNIFGSMPGSSNDRIPHAISRLGKDTDGFRPKDLQIVATRILHLDYLRNFHCQLPELDKESSSITLQSEISSILEDYSPLSQQLVDIEHNASMMNWESIGGLYKAKQSLHDSIIHPMRFRQVYDHAPMALPTGMLLYGPPGNGKSFIVPLLAKKSKLNLITCRGPELLDRYIGASEAKVRQLFARANAASPCMIFFDEFDSLAPQRGSDHTGVTDRVVNQLLTLLDGAESSSKKASHIFIVAATSRPDKIDKALLRPGRLEKHVYVGYPESLVEWNSLFSSLLESRNVDEEVSHLKQGGEDLFNSFCKDFEYAKEFSAADMKAVLDTAHLLCVHDILDADNMEGGAEHGPAILRKHHILEAFRRTRPSLLPKDRQVLQRIYASFGSNTMKQPQSDNPSGHTLKTALR